jgi:hypothetical protein
LDALLIIPLFLAGASPAIVGAGVAFRNKRLNLRTAGFVLALAFTGGSFAAAWFDGRLRIGFFIAEMVVSMVIMILILLLMASNRARSTRV